jgi:hypothetical protein
MTIEQPDPGGVSCTMRIVADAVSWSTTKPQLVGVEHLARSTSETGQDYF